MSAPFLVFDPPKDFVLFNTRCRIALSALLLSGGILGSVMHVK